MSEQDAGEGLPTTDNTMSGSISGQVVQAGSVGEIHFHQQGGLGERPVPAQLPPVSRSFASRERELQVLGSSRGADRHDSGLVVFSGIAGAGKTSLALRWLHELRGGYPDGQLFIDLAGGSSRPVVPSTALEWFLLSLGVPARQIPLEPAQREALYRTVTASCRLVVLLDNAVSAAQVRPLIPAGDQSVTVVTSRWRLSGLVMDGARWVEVKPLDVSSSVGLLEHMLGPQRVSAEADAARELAALCGGLPLALSIVAARLSTRPRRTLAREVGDLRVEQRRLAGLALAEDTSVEAVLDLSYEGLGEEAERLYRMCAAHPGREFGVDVAAAAAGWGIDHTESTLDILLEANFLTEVDDRRFTLHDLLRLHAQRRAEKEDSPEGRDTVLLRMIEWYLDRTVTADIAIHPLRPHLGPRYSDTRSVDSAFVDERDALSWLEVERPNLRSVLDSASRHRWYELAWQICEALWGFFLHTRHYSDWIEMHRVGIDSAQQCRNRRAEARLRSQLGFAYAKLGRYHDAAAENTRALRLAEVEQDAQATATALSQLGRASRGLDDLPAALRYFTEARDIQRRLGEWRGVALCRRRIGQILARLGRFDEAMPELLAAVATMKELGDRTQHARALMVLGATHAHAGNVDLAFPPLREALALMRDLGSPYYQAEILAHLGDTAQRSDDLELARNNYLEARSLYRAVGDPRADVMQERLDSLV